MLGKEQENGVMVKLFLKGNLLLRMWSTKKKDFVPLYKVAVGWATCCHDNQILLVRLMIYIFAKE